MSDLEISRRLAEAELEVVRREVVTLSVHAGERPASVNGRHSDTRLLVSWPTEWDGPEDGELRLENVTAKAVRGGRMRWYCLAAADGRCVAHGDVGAGLVADRQAVEAGDVVELKRFGYRVPTEG